MLYNNIYIVVCLGGNMKYRKLGNTDLDVSVICLGTMSIAEQNSEKDSHEQLSF